MRDIVPKKKKCTAFQQMLYPKKMMNTRESIPPRQADPSSHEPPFHTPSDLLQLLERLFGPRKDWHAN